MSTMSNGVAWFARLLRYDAWANGETLASLHTGNPPAKAFRWMAHLVGSGELWLARLTSEPPGMAVWPELDIEQCAAGVARLGRQWSRYLGTLRDEDLEESVGYRNTRGEYWTSTVADILTHVTTHGSYHRGQIAATVRESGGEPAYTDFIHAVRQGIVP